MPTKTWFTSDTHFGHENIIKYCARPFSSREEMDEAMVVRWNDVVAPGDHVYHLGDFCFGPAHWLPLVRQKLNGTVTLVMGNHDRHTATKYRGAGFEEVVKGALSRKVDGRSVWMRHVPPADEYVQAWKFVTDAFLCGHVHDRWRVRKPDGYTHVVNVGVDQWDFKPVSLEQLLGALV